MINIDKITFEDFKNTVEREFLITRLHINNFNMAKTAKELKIQRSHLYNLTGKYRIKKSDRPLYCFPDQIFVIDSPVFPELDFSNEIWKTYPKNPDYMVSDMGRVKLTEGGILPQGLGKLNSYPTVSIRDFETGKPIAAYAYRLVAETFCEKEEGKTHVNHKNRIRTDSRAINLEWVTPSENVIHSKNSGIGEMNSAGMFSS